MQKTLELPNVNLLDALDGRTKDWYSVAADSERILRLMKLVHKFLMLLSLNSAGPSTILGPLDDAELYRPMNTNWMMR